MQDAPPARYAVESDSEDEVGFYPGTRPAREKHRYKVEIRTSAVGEAGLVVACGKIGAVWASGLEGDLVGDVVLDEVKVRSSGLNMIKVAGITMEFGITDRSLSINSLLQRY